METKKSQEWLSRGMKVIPSGTQTFSKGPNQWVRGVSPAYLERGEGPWVWDVDGNRYLDYVMALGSVSLGYGDPDIERAVVKQIKDGAGFSMMHPLEVEVAEKVCRLVPCAEMVRFGKNGSDATSGIVRAARAFTGRSRVAVCGYHGWQDWYVASTTRNAGVPTGVADLTSTFDYNSLESLEKTLSTHPGEFALVILEPMSFTFPCTGFLEGVRELTHKHGALLAFDEVITGFRMSPGGAQQYFGVLPDIAAFGKGMANGLPISCIAGRRDVMQVFDEIFYSFTFASEVVSLAAANAFLDIVADGTVLSEVAQHGEKLKAELKAIIDKCVLSSQMEVLGHGSHWGLVLSPKNPDEGRLWRTFLIQECTKRGYLFFGSHNPTRAHDGNALDFAVNVYSEVLPLFSDAIEKGNMLRRIEGELVEAIFRVHK
jgi:glutamate-1-semialdehyde 2,1-aminomutase